MIFAVFDPSPLTVCINCSFLHLFPVRRDNFGDSAINKGYIAYFYCTCAKRPYFYFRSKNDVTVVFFDPDFLEDARISAIRVHLTQL